MQMFVKALQQGNPQTKVIVLAFQYPFFSSDYLWKGVRVIAFGGKSRGQIFRLATWLGVWRALINLNKEYQLKGLLSFWLGECAFVANWFGRFKGLPHYCWLLGQDAKAGNKYAGWLSLKKEQLIALSDFIARQYASNYGITPATVIPLGIDAGAFKAPAPERDIDILGAGSLIPLKQYDIFIRIISQLKPFYPNIKAVICGDGPERGRLQQTIKKLNMQHNIQLMGEVPHPLVLAFMQRSKILLHTSVYEGFGAVCLEALYAGAQVVSFVKPMDAIIPKWGIAANEQEMMHKISKILDGPQPNYTPAIPYAIADNARAMAILFGL
jgi:glycosyltransferase involved in cell wall biosynthesis